MTICPNCQSDKTSHIYTIKNVVTSQNTLLFSLDSALHVPRGQIELVFCENCTFVYNQSFDETLTGYGEVYENDQTYSSVFTTHVDQMVNNILENHAFTRHKILEIGCGNGYFLRKLVQNNHNTGVGFDKSLSLIADDQKLSFKNKYYSAQDEGGFDVIILRHVVEHILSNVGLFRLLAEKNPAASFFVETPSLEWILENEAFFDIFYEHCSYFSEYSLRHMLSAANISITDLEHVFQGQYMWCEGNLQTISQKSFPPPRITRKHLKNFFQKMDQFVAFNKERIQKAGKKGKVAVWGAGAKGITFVNQIDPQQQYISCLIDINPKKQEKYCSGTGHVIKNPVEACATEEVKTIFVMNPNYLAEIKKTHFLRSVEFICV